jgi:hypothetical protein
MLLIPVDRALQNKCICYYFIAQQSRQLNRRWLNKRNSRDKEQFRQSKKYPKPLQYQQYLIIAEELLRLGIGTIRPPWAAV